MNLRWAHTACDLCDVRLLGLCRAFDGGEIDQLENVVFRREYAPNETVFLEGDPAEHLYAITGGAVRLSKTHYDGRRQIVGFLLPGNVAGLDAHDTHVCTAESVATTRICRFGRAALQEIANRVPEIQRRLTWLASHDLARAEELLMVLGRLNAQERLAFFLVGLHAREASRGDPDAQIFLPMTRTDIADYLGLTIETISRTFSKFAREGLIEVRSAHYVHLTDLRKLKEIAGVFLD